MRNHWIGKNVNLKMLSSHVEVFFKDRGFLTKTEELLEGYRILAEPSNPGVPYKSIDVEIIGKLNDLVIEFRVGKRSRLSTPIRSLVTLFGGGGFILQELKSQEALEKLEKEFWTFVGELVAGLGKTSKSLH